MSTTDLISGDLLHKLRRMGCTKATNVQDIELMNRDDVHHMFEVLFERWDDQLAWDIHNTDSTGNRKNILKNLSLLDLGHLKKDVKHMQPNNAKFFRAIESIVDKLEVKLGDDLYSYVGFSTASSKENQGSSANVSTSLSASKKTPSLRKTPGSANRDPKRNSIASGRQLDRTPVSTNKSRSRLSVLGTPYENGSEDKEGNTESFDAFVDRMLNEETTEEEAAASYQSPEPNNNPFSGGSSLARTPISVGKSKLRQPSLVEDHRVTPRKGTRTPIGVSTTSYTTPVASKSAKKSAKKMPKSGNKSAKKTTGSARKPVDSGRIHSTVNQFEKGVEKFVIDESAISNPFASGGGLMRTPPAKGSTRPVANANANVVEVPKQPVFDQVVDDAFAPKGGLARTPPGQQAKVQQQVQAQAQAQPQPVVMDQFDAFGSANPFGGGGLARTPPSKYQAPVQAQPQSQLDNANPFGSRNAGLPRTPVTNQQRYAEDQPVQTFEVADPFGSRNGGLARTPVQKKPEQPEPEPEQPQQESMENQIATLSPVQQKASDAHVVDTPAAQVMGDPLNDSSMFDITPPEKTPEQDEIALLKEAHNVSTTVDQYDEPLPQESSEPEQVPTTTTTMTTTTTTTTAALSIPSIPTIGASKRGLGLDNFLGDVMSHGVYDTSNDIAARIQQLQKPKTKPMVSSSANAAEKQDQEFLNVMSTAREYQNIQSHLSEAQSVKETMDARHQQLQLQTNEVEQDMAVLNQCKAEFVDQLATVGVSSSTEMQVGEQVNVLIESIADSEQELAVLREQIINSEGEARRDLVSLDKQLKELTQEQDDIKARLSNQSQALEIIRQDFRGRIVEIQLDNESQVTNLKNEQREFEKVEKEYHRVRNLWMDKINEAQQDTTSDRETKKAIRILKRIDMYIGRYRSLQKNAKLIQMAVM